MKLKVFILHGMGEAQSGYSAALQKNTARELANHGFRSGIDFKFYEINYDNGLLRQHQSDYSAAVRKYYPELMEYRDKLVKNTLGADSLREFIIKFIGDVAAYRRRSYPQKALKNVYENVHDRITDVLELSLLDSRDALSIFIAHSLGGQVLSNYLYDYQNLNGQGEPLVLDRSLAVITMGTILPLFQMAYQGEAEPVRLPGKSVPKNLWRFAIWHNFMDPADILALPMSLINSRFAHAAADGKIRDIVQSATPPTNNFWNGITKWFKKNTPASHNAYFEEEYFHRKKIAPILLDILKSL